MSTLSKIEWTEATWNPTVGCSPVSEGCRNCYAAREAIRLAGNPHAKVGGLYAGTSEMRGTGASRRAVFTGVVRTVPDRLDQPLRWRKPRRIFVDSMSDLFHEDVPDEFIVQVFAIMAEAQRHVFQILTKRPARMAALLSSPSFWGAVDLEWCERFWAATAREHGLERYEEERILGPLPNVWLGTSVEDQAAADERIPHLLRTPAAVRFLSCEPLLGPVDITRIRPADLTWLEPLAGRAHDEPSVYTCARIDWVIAGGESGPGARPCDIAWIRSLVEQCRRADVPTFVKQLGAFPIQHSYVPYEPQYEALELNDRKGGDPEEWPEDLRVRGFPC